MLEGKGNRFTDGFLGGNGEGEGDAVAGEEVADNRESCCWGIAFTGEVSEVDMFEVVVCNRGEKLSTRFIGEVAMPT